MPRSKEATKEENSPSTSHLTVPAAVCFSVSLEVSDWYISGIILVKSLSVNMKQSDSEKRLCYSECSFINEVRLLVFFYIQSLLFPGFERNVAFPY